MSIFGDTKKEKPDLKFTTRAEAFAYMLAYQLEKGNDPMEAASKANEFADIFAVNMGIPTIKEPEPEGVDRYLRSFDKVVCYCEEHPNVVNFISGAFTFAVGTFFGKKEEQRIEPPRIEQIDINKLD